MTHRMPLSPTALPRLRPGVRVLERGADVVQVGLDPSRALRLPATPGVRRALAALSGGRPVDGRDDEVDDVIARLADAGHLVDGPPHRPLAEVRRIGPPSGAVEAALTESTVGPDPLGVVLLVCTVEPARSLLDDLVATDRPHLLVRFTEGDAVVGPFVVPGTTACLRCVDAHRSDVDPRWPLLVEQQARPLDPGPVDPADPLLARLALTWAARDLATHAAGAELPASWSSTLRFPPALTGFEATGWLRHPACGCSLDLPRG